MALVLSEEQALLKSSALDFFKSKAPIEAFRKLRDDKSVDGFDRKIYAEMVELGFAGLTITEAFGGFDFGYVALGQVLEVNGRTLTASPLISTVLFGATALNIAGTEDQKSTLLPLIASGEILVSLAHEEKTHHDPTFVNCTAVKDGNNYILNGKKTFVLDATVADKFIVVAKTKEEIGLFVVDANTPGLKVEKTQMLDSRNAGSISLENVKISASNKLSGGFKELCKVYDIASIGLAAEMLGISLEAFERTVAYLKERKQFGVSIGSFQALQHRAAKMFIEIELSKSILIKALTAIDENAENLSELASLAKAKLGQTVKLVTNEAIQMHGGIGMTDDMDFGFFIKRARVLQHTLGDYNYHLDRYARLNGY